ncbi:hemolysin family protein [Catalinimonas niigatensis]|uniref:hemolysin family protein n=1 Tax=Catalinimonas niigatensis TaxID=1397264 RepID=UPI00266609AA|nr:hemolysin family protein [Catalinimonas niigatensis]WPP48836.1 hemolysin family protein [Catalinimonas niigatensis]
MDYYSITVVIICLLFSAFFSGIEIAFISADKLRIELARKQGIVSGRLLSHFLQKPSRFIGTTLVGNNIALVLYGIFMANLLEPWLVAQLPEVINNDILILIIQTILATILVLIVAEFTPKSTFLIDPNGLLSIFAIPMTIIYYIMYPFVWGIDKISQFVIKYVLGFKYREDKPVFGLTDLNNYIKNTLSNDILQESNKRLTQQTNPRVDTKIFSNALEFKTVKVRECMIPRTEVVAVDIEDNIQELKEAFMQSGHSKIIVYKESIDEVIGYCHSLELFKKPESITQILTPIIIVPETIPANELMIQFITEHKSLALVVDEFGGTAGIVSMEDIIEEIFGDIQDEHDVEDWVEMQLDENNFLISARHEIDYLNEKFNWVIPSGDYDTLGGYILSLTGEIPSTGNIITLSPFTFTIMSMHENRIDNVKVTVNNKRQDT